MSTLTAENIFRLIEQLPLAERRKLERLIEERPAGRPQKPDKAPLDKRLPAEPMPDRTREMDWTALKLLLEGIEPGRLRKRFRYTASAQKPTSASSHAINFTHAERTEDLPEHRRDRTHAER